MRLATFVVWALALASAAYWGLRLGASPAGPAAAVVPPAASVQADPERVARLLGAVPASAAAPVVQAAASRFTLVGVVAGSSRQGAALIAVDGKPAKPFRVGATVDGSLVLQSVGPRTAALAPSVDGPASVTLEMPVRTGAAGASGAGGAAPTRYAGAPPVPMPAAVPAPAVATPPTQAAPGMSPQAESERRRAFGRPAGSRSDGEAAPAASAPAQQP